MYLEYFNGWQQLDLDTNLDKSTSTLQMFMKTSETLRPIEHQPVYTAKMQEAQVECPFMDSSFSSATM